jgi:hypothetical protein
LCETICLRVGLGCKRIAETPQMGESTLLSSYPDIILAVAGDGVNDIVRDPIGCDCSTFSALQPSQTTLNRRNPSAAARVNVQWPHTLPLQIRKRVRYESAASQSLEAARATDPNVSIPIFEERTYRSGDFVCTQERNPARVVPKESAARADPDVRVPIAKNGKYVDVEK